MTRRCCQCVMSSPPLGVHFTTPPAAPSCALIPCVTGRDLFHSSRGAGLHSRDRVTGKGRGRPSYRPRGSRRLGFFAAQAGPRGLGPHPIRGERK